MVQDELATVKKKNTEIEKRGMKKYLAIDRHGKQVRDSEAHPSLGVK